MKFDTMKASLHRDLLYSKKFNLEDFGLPEIVQDKLYELYVTTKDSAVGNNYSVVDVFNEIFYALTSIYNDPSAAEHVGEYLQKEISLFPDKTTPNDSVRGYQTYDEAYENQQFLAKRYVYSFVWLILEINLYKPKNVKFFLIALDKQIRERNPYFDIFFKFRNKYQWNFEMDFPPCPQIFYSQSAKEWYEETKDFDQEIVSNIVRRFGSVTEKEMVIDTIKKAIEATTDSTKPILKISRKTFNDKANNEFLDKLLDESRTEDTQRRAEEQAIEKSKDERITELEAQIEDLRQEKNDAIHDKKEAERERDKYRKKLEELTSRLNRKHIPAVLKSEEAKLIIEELVNQDLITPLGYNSVLQFYRWEGTGALFGYFVDKMNFQLELADSGGRINWKPFKQAFSNYEEKEKRARDTVSHYKQHPYTKMPENAEKIDDAIAIAEEKLANK